MKEKVGSHILKEKLKSCLLFSQPSFIYTLVGMRHTGGCWNSSWVFFLCFLLVDKHQWTPTRTLFNAPNGWQLIPQKTNRISEKGEEGEGGRRRRDALLASVKSSKWLMAICFACLIQHKLSGDSSPQWGFSTAPFQSPTKNNSFSAS